MCNSTRFNDNGANVVKSVSRVILLVAAVLALAACAPGPNKDAVRSADIGPYPNDYERIIKRAIGEGLKDPYSAMYTFDRGPLRGGLRDMYGRVSDYDFFGWIVCGTVNARNSYGGYVGASQYVAVIRSGRVIYHHLVSPSSTACSNNIVWD